MENKQKNKQWLYILIGIIIGGILFGGSIYYLTSNNKEDNQKNSNKNEEKKEDLKTTPIKVLSGNYASSPITFILYNNEVYVSFEPCPRKITNGEIITYENEYDQEFCEYVEKFKNNYKEYNFNNLEYQSISANSYLSSYEPVLKSKFYGIKLNTSNVETIYATILGQDTIPKEQGIAILKSDGTVEFISFFNIVNNNIVPTSLNLKNIVSFKTTSQGGVSIYAIDNTGKEYHLYDYIDKE